MSKKAEQKQQEATPILEEFFFSKYSERSGSSEMFLSDSERDSVSYAFGVDLGANLKKSDLPIHFVWTNEALSDIFEHCAESRMTEEESMMFLQNYFSEFVPKQNAEISAAWLAQAAKEKGAKVTESGLVYRVKKQGDMSKVASSENDVIEVKYTMKNYLGKELDSNVNDSIEILLGSVIHGWQEGVKLVGEGGRIELLIPSDLAYGTYGAGAHIGANEALYFDIELLSINE